jgi:hypothetical protein
VHLAHRRAPVLPLSIYSANVGTPISFARMVALDANGGHVGIVSERQSSRAMGFDYHGGAVIDWNGAKPGQVLMTRAFVPEMTTGTHLAQTDEGLGWKASMSSACNAVRCSTGAPMLVGIPPTVWAMSG